MTERYYYASVHVEGTAHTETVEEILTSTEEEPKFVDAIIFQEDSSTQQRDALIVAYIEREKIMEVPIMQNLQMYDSNPRACGDLWYPLGHDLPVGQSLRVGHVSGSDISDIYYTVRYQIKE